MCGRLSRQTVTEVQREAQTSASYYAQLNTSILVHSSLHCPEQMNLHVDPFPLCYTYDLQD